MLLLLLPLLLDLARTPLNGDWNEPWAAREIKRNAQPGTPWHVVLLNYVLPRPRRLHRNFANPPARTSRSLQGHSSLFFSLSRALILLSLSSFPFDLYFSSLLFLFYSPSSLSLVSSISVFFNFLKPSFYTHFVCARMFHFFSLLVTTEISRIFRKCHKFVCSLFSSRKMLDK